MNEKLTPLLMAQAVTRLDNQGVHFAIFVPSEKMGGGNFSLAAGDVIRYAKDPVAFMAELLGVALDDYRSWYGLWEQSEYGLLECQGTRRGGKRCRNPVGIPPAGEYKRGDQVLCEHHMSVNAKVAKKEKKEKMQAQWDRQKEKGQEVRRQRANATREKREKNKVLRAAGYEWNPQIHKWVSADGAVHCDATKDPV